MRTCIRVFDLSLVVEVLSASQSFVPREESSAYGLLVACCRLDRVRARIGIRICEFLEIRVLKESARQKGIRKRELRYQLEGRV